MVSISAAQENNDTYKWLLLSIVLLGSFMATLDASIVNVSLPAIMASFGASVDQIEWVVTGYMLTFASLISLTSWMRDRVGSKKLFTVSLAIFTFGSVLCAVSWNLPSLIFARVLQAAGGGAVNPTAMAMISDVFEPRERAKALGYWGVGVIVGPAIGPTLGGYLTYDISWRAIFMVNLPIGIIATILSIFLIRKDKEEDIRRRPFDFFGFIFLAAFLIALLLGLNKGNSKGWTSPYIMTCVAVGVFSLIGFLTVETQIEHPILDLSIFKNKIFTSSFLVTAGRSVGLFGGVFLLPLFMEIFMGFDEIKSGLVLLPGAIVIGFMMPLAPKIADKFGVRTVAIIGLLLVAWFMFDYRSIDVSTSVWGIIGPTLIRGIGIGLLVAPLMATALNAVPKSKTGQATVLLNLIQQVAGSIGIAVLGTVLDIRTKFHLLAIGSALNPNTPAVREAMQGIFYRTLRLGYSPAVGRLLSRVLLIKNAVMTAAVAGYQDSFIFGAAIVLFAIVFALFLPQESVGHESGEPVILE